jgi:hypothetical protein
MIPFAIGAAALLIAVVVPARSSAQDTVSAPLSGAHPPHYWRDVAAGFAASILLHESAHIVASYALGAHPHFGLDDGRPTIFSGINARLEPAKQFRFSSAGLAAQSLLDEGILDTPHQRGSAFERGVLAGGIGTALFYATIGRSGSVSDVDYMSRTSSLSKTDLTILLGGISVLHLVRMAHDGHYANFFLRPGASGGLRIGVWTQ